MWPWWEFMLAENAVPLQVLNGVLLHQTRHSPPIGSGRCWTRFQRLDRQCTLPLGVPMAQADGDATGGGPAPFGSDPMFNPRSDLFNPQLQGRASSFYNTSAAAGEVTSVGMPRGFFPRPAHGLPPGFPVVFEARPMTHLTALVLCSAHERCSGTLHWEELCIHANAVSSCRCRRPEGRWSASCVCSPKVASWMAEHSS